jgi:hypothetical protein
VLNGYENVYILNVIVQIIIFFSPYHLRGRRFLTENEKKELKAKYKENKIQWIEQYKGLRE